MAHLIYLAMRSITNNQSFYLSIYLSPLASAPENPLQIVMDRQICDRSAITNRARGDVRERMRKSGCERADARELSLVMTGHMRNGSGCESGCMTADARADAISVI